MSTNIEERVKRVIAYQLGADASTMRPDTRFVEDLGADSLDQIEIVMALEDEFAIQIDDDEAEKVTTVQQAIDFMARQPA